MKWCRSHDYPYLRLLQKAQGSGMFISRVSEVVCFVDGDGEERFPKDGASEGLLRLRYIPWTGTLLLRFSVRLLEVIEEGLNKPVSTILV